MIDDDAAVCAPTEPPEPEWLEDLRDDLRRLADRQPPRPEPSLLDRLLGRG